MLKHYSILDSTKMWTKRLLADIPESGEKLPVALKKMGHDVFTSCPIFQHRC